MATLIHTDWPYWWVTFTDTTPPRFVYAKGIDAAREGAAKVGPVADVKTLPYPSAKSPNGVPDFCHSPRECAGRTACPHSYSCTE